MARQREVPSGSTGAEIASGIATSLGKKAISWTVNGEHWDLAWPLNEDASIAIHTLKDDAQALELIRHDAAHINGACSSGDLARCEGHYRASDRERFLL